MRLSRNTRLYLQLIAGFLIGVFASALGYEMWDPDYWFLVSILNFFVAVALAVFAED